MKLNNKFEIGEKIFTVKRVNIEVECAICGGVGKIEHLGYTMVCPECKGKKVIETRHTLWNVVNVDCKIRRIKASIGKENCTI